jgi:hypothetical protein
MLIKSPIRKPTREKLIQLEVDLKENKENKENKETKEQNKYF